MKLRLLVVVAALAGLLVAANASAVTASRIVGVHVVLSGRGTMRLAGGLSFTCHARTRKPCSHTFHVQRGSWVMLRALPQKGWKLTTWAGGCRGSSPTCSLRLGARRDVTVTFVPPGDVANPYRLRRAVRLDGWRLKVDAATLDANTRVEAVIDPQTGEPANAPPPAGTQYTLVKITLTYLRPGSSRAPLEVYVRSHLRTEGPTRGAFYAADSSCEAPPIDLGSTTGHAASGASVTGYACYEIASRDASTLLLSPNVSVRKGGPWYRGVSFALRR